MSGTTPNKKFFECVLCKKHPKPKERRKVNDGTVTFLTKYFFVSYRADSVVCNKCAHKCYKIKDDESAAKKKDEDTPDDPEFNPVTKRPRSVPEASPPIPSTSRGHSYCFICKNPGPKLVVTPTQARFAAYIRSGVFIPAGSRCCPGHLIDGLLSLEALKNINKTNDSTNLNRSSILELLKQARNEVLRKENYRLDFDNPSSLSDQDYLNLIGVTKAHFDDIMGYIADVRSSKSRSARTCVAVLLTKLRSALDNKMLGTLFNISKSQIRRAVASARTSLVSSFVPQNLGFVHLSRREVIDIHTRPLAKGLFANDVLNDQAILVLDGTYIYIQKSVNFSFQRRSFSMHKHRPLVKPMMIVTTTGYIVAVLGPYLAYNKNNDASILNHMVATNADEMTEWIQEDDVFVVDWGFRDSTFSQRPRCENGNAFVPAKWKEAASDRRIEQLKARHKDTN